MLAAALAVAASLAAPAAAAPRMWVGFHDDWGFRWGSDRQELLDRATEADATLLRTTVYWSRMTSERPARPRDSFDPAYNFADLDELLRNAQVRGMQVLLTIWGTPAWANGGAGENRAPVRAADLGDFAYALADRYSGRHAGYPFVRFFTVWNEPNLNQFLAPQFDGAGHDAAVETYARIYRAAYAGIKAANPSALVGMGEVSHHGTDSARGAWFQPSHSPVRFAEGLARVRPALRFDAFAVHPYPMDPRRSPEAQGRWPDVTLTQLPRFEDLLDRAFDRRVPVWLTEYGYQSAPGVPGGLAPALQGRFLDRAFRAALADPRVEVFVWFVLRDRTNVHWQGGLLHDDGSPKPGFARFGALARLVDARNPIVSLPADRESPVVRMPAIRLGAFDDPGAPVGVTYRIFRDGHRVQVAQPLVALDRDSWISLPLRRFVPRRGGPYVLFVTAEDIHGNRVEAKLQLVPVGGRLFAPPRRREGNAIDIVSW